MTAYPPTAAPLVAERLVVTGHVQAVGFRPFVYRLAHALGLSGWVQNQTGQVEIGVQGPASAVAAFGERLITQAPPLARPRLELREKVTTGDFERFVIRPSAAVAESRIYVPPDYFTCEACLNELSDPDDRRHRYPFINCTECGPRYTLIRALPYDRPNTTLAGFPLCPACRAEYENPLDRRFHAEPVACPECGPRLEYCSPVGGGGETGEAALQAALALLSSGRVLAVKGVGGYHLMCAARDGDAVARLRTRKHRPDKPLAVMFPSRGVDGLDALRADVELSGPAAALIASPMRPIVLVRRRAGSSLAAGIAPGLAEIGVFLPYSPLHHLLLSGFAAPLVATSGNLSGEPVLTDNDEAERRLPAIADAFLHHDRPIERPADDPVFRPIGGRCRPIRLGRGVAPLELELPLGLDTPLLAAGGHMKNTLALAWEDRVVVSPHIGEMDSPRSLAVFEQVAADLQRLYGVRAERVVCDAHLGYTTTRWARETGLPLTRVWHHHAHASALAAEHGVDEDWLIFAWDGVGFGVDGTLWGGETFWGRPGCWERIASLRPFRLPGGDKAGREPWRSACGLCWELGLDWRGAPEGSELAHQAWQRGVNAPQTSAVGRLFDAAAAMVLGHTHSSFEGQGPMWLESCADATANAVALPVATDEAGVLRIDWSPLPEALQDSARPVSERAGLLHASLADAIAEVVRLVRARRGAGRVGLTGGVFQNRLLTERVLERLRPTGVMVGLAERVPCNDAGLSFGQVVEVAAAR